MDGPPRHASAADAALPPVPPVEAEPQGRMWGDEPFQYQCLSPLGGRDSTDVKRTLAALTKVGVFPAPHPTVLTEDDLWKLGSYPYRVLPRPAGLRMLLCLLKVQGRTLSVLVRENMMVVRVAMGKLPFSLFKGTVLLGYATQEQDGSAAFSVTDALFSKGANVGRMPWQPRRQAVQEFARAYDPEDSGFSLYVPPMAPARDPVFWRSLDGDWRSLLFVPEERSLKLGAAQSTLFELSRLDIDSVAEAMTNEVVDTGDDTSFRPRFGLAPPPTPAPPRSTPAPSNEAPAPAAAPSAGATSSSSSSAAAAGRAPDATAGAAPANPGPWVPWATVASLQTFRIGDGRIGDGGVRHFSHPPGCPTTLNCHAHGSAVRLQRSPTPAGVVDQGALPQLGQASPPAGDPADGAAAEALERRQDVPGGAAVDGPQPEAA